MGHIFQINASNGGVPKRAVREAEVAALGLAGRSVGALARERGTRNAQRFVRPRILQAEHEGWSRVYARVLETGRIRVGERVRLM